MAELWTRIGSATNANKNRTDIELELIIATGLFTGVRVNIGMSAEIAVVPTVPDLTYIGYVLRRLAAAGLKVQIGLGGDGPPMNTAWKAFNGTLPWNSKKRPPIGGDEEFPYNTGAIKTAVIDLAIEIYYSYGLEPYDYIILELYNEPAVGGAGAPPPDGGGDTFYATSGIDYATSIGLWDSEGDYDPSWDPEDGASFIEYFSTEMFYLETRGLRCIAPTFAAKDLENELATMDTVPVMGLLWYDTVRVKSPLLFGLNSYYNAFSDGTAVLNQDQFVWPTIGPVRYAGMAVFGRDRRGLKSNDPQCALARIALLRTSPIIGMTPIVIVEAGVTPRFLGMTDLPDTQVIGDRDQTYFVNFQVVAEATLAYLDGLLGHSGAPWVIHFSASDAITTYSGTFWKELWGFFLSTATIGAIPSPASQLTYSASLPWLRRAGLPTTSPDATLPHADRGSFWGHDFERGEDENVF